MSATKAGKGPGPGPVGTGGPLPENPVLGTGNARPGVTGNSNTNIGVLGQSVGSQSGAPASDGVFGLGQNGVHGEAYGIGGSGVLGEDKSSGNRGNGVSGSSMTGTGVFGASQQGHGVHGVNSKGFSAQPPPLGTGVWGESDNGLGVYGASNANSGVHGVSANVDGVHGESHAPQHAGVSGSNTSSGSGVWGSSNSGHGVYGQTASPSVGNAGVSGVNNGQGPGVYGSSSKWDGVHGDSSSSGHAGVSGVNTNGGIGVYGASSGEAGHFEGAFTVNGKHVVNGDHVVSGTVTVGVDIVLSGGQDCAEEFDLVADADAEPGTVMVFSDDAALRACNQAYDKRVAGVVSGAGDYKPAVVLDKRASSHRRASVGLIGKVFCKADAQYAPIDVGDVLTTSPTIGHAMKATDSAAAFGTVIGKALRPLQSGQGLIPILVTLQ